MICGELLPLLLLKHFDLYLFARYLVDQRWLKQWKKYVGFETRAFRYAWIELTSAGNQEAHPGPVDNAGLLKCTVQSLQQVLYQLDIFSSTK